MQTFSVINITGNPVFDYFFCIVVTISIILVPIKGIFRVINRS